MFQALSSKIISGFISLSMLLLSSYEGNRAAFAELTASFLGDKIFIKTELVHAFENDFEEIFKSGQRIDIFFNIELKNQSVVIHENEFKHSVVFNPLSQFFTIGLEEQNISTTTDSYQELIDIISKVEYQYEGEELNEVNISIKSFLKKIRLQSINKEYDMMMLWKFKKPSIKKICRKGEDEN